MEAFDTNVVVRILVRDDEEQCERAEQALRAAIAGGGVWLSVVVLVETAWVLRGAYKLERAAIAAALTRIVRTEGVGVESPAAILAALDRYVAGPADFSDYVILESAARAGALPVRTFDVRLAAAEGAAAGARSSEIRITRHLGLFRLHRGRHHDWPMGATA